MKQVSAGQNGGDYSKAVELLARARTSPDRGSAIPSFCGMWRYRDRGILRRQRGPMFASSGKVGQQSRIRVLIVDDHAIVRLGLRAILGTEPVIDVVGEAATAVNAIEMVADLTPEVMLVDLRLDRGSGLDVLRAARARGSATRCVVFTHSSDEADVYDAIAGGADGYVLKSGDCMEVLAAVRAVHSGRRYICSSASSSLAAHVQRPSLTAREQEVLELLARGSTNKSIARVLRVADETVKAHVRSILAKVDARGRTEAVAKALQRGLVRFRQ